MNDSQMRGKRVLITGASSGLGSAMAVQLAREGCRLALAARREDRLLEVAGAVKEAGADCLSFVEDVTDPESVRRDYQSIKDRWGGLDWAILNAGVGGPTNAASFSAEKVRSTFATNVLGVAYWLEEIIPDMIAARSGLIAGIASLAAYRGLPNKGAYAASKAALVTLLESTRVDLRGTGVEVVIVAPGFIKSEMTAPLDPRRMPFLLETEDGARRIIAGIKSGRRVVHFPWQLSLPVIYLLSWLPGWLYDRLVAPKARPSST